MVSKKKITIDRKQQQAFLERQALIRKNSSIENLLDENSSIFESSLINRGFRLRNKALLSSLGIAKYGVERKGHMYTVTYNVSNNADKVSLYRGISRKFITENPNEMKPEFMMSIKKIDPKKLTNTMRELMYSVNTDIQSRKSRPKEESQGFYHNRYFQFA